MIQNSVSLSLSINRLGAETLPARLGSRLRTAAAIEPSTRGFPPHFHGQSFSDSGRLRDADEIAYSIQKLGSRNTKLDHVIFSYSHIGMDT